LFGHPVTMLIVLVPALCLVVLTAYASFVTWRHRRAVDSIPIRVHVNGTRGKSTVTRLIAAGFRAAGYRTVAKTTGTAARLILEDGSELDLERSGPANIGEQVEIVRSAAKRKAEVLVIECMAVLPELQTTSQQSIVRGTCGVVTNVRPDHQEVMGEALEEIAWHLAAVSPPGGYLVTGEQSPTVLEVLKARATTLGAELLVADPATAPSAKEFGRHEFPDNLALALRVCEVHGIDRETALAGMRTAAMDPGALSEQPLRLEGREVLFVNAFAANDLVSTEQIIRSVCERRDERALVLMVNARRDRARRTEDMALLVCNGFRVHSALLIGDGAGALERIIARVRPDLPLLNVAGLPKEAVLKAVSANVPDNAYLLGIGNIGGPAGEVCEYLAAGAGGA